MDQHDPSAEALPLAGTTVVALEQAVAAPFATRQLVDLGARVIKIERPDGGDFSREYDHTVSGESSYFVWLNRGKESACLDLKDPDDLAIVRAAIDEADVFVQNLAPGAVERLGLDPVELRTSNPRLITCSISGFGPGGPMEQFKAYDLLVQCEAGMLSVTGTPDEMAKVGVSIVDIATGVYAYTGILTALLHRASTSRGTHVEITMLEAIGEWMIQPHLFARHGGTEPRRSGARHASIAPYGPFRSGDGGRVFLAVQSDREWVRLCSDVFGDPALAADPRFLTNELRARNVEDLTIEIESRVQDHTRESLVDALQSASIATAELRSVKELADHPQLRARSRWTTVRTPTGEVEVLRPPATVSGVGFVVGDVPGMGEHTDRLRAQYGHVANSGSR